MAADPKDLGALEKAVNDASGKAGALWLSFISFATLVLITTGTVTHKQLFLEEPLALPLLNAKLPLIGYFVAAPLFFVIFHFYLLLQLEGLATRVRVYDELLRQAHPVASDRRLLRQRLDTFIVAQLLAGARERREGLLGFLNRFVAWITLVALPIATLLIIQLIFLPYHHQGVTWWHRICVLADLGLLWVFWRRMTTLDGDLRTPLMAVQRLRRSARKAGRSAAALMQVVDWRMNASPDIWRNIARRTLLDATRIGTIATVPIAVFSVLVACYPGEYLYHSKLQLPLSALTRAVLERNPDPLTGASAFNSNRLLLPNQDFGIEQRLIEWEKANGSQAGKSRPLDKRVTLSLRGRDLTGAMLDRTDLRQADFIGARLTDASLSGANLERAVFECDPPTLNPQSFMRPCTDLTRAQLVGTILRRANLSRASIRGANLFAAQLEEAILEDASLHGAMFVGARLHGANFSDAKLYGANLQGVQAEGADFTNAHLQGAKLDSARLQGAKLENSLLDGASLNLAQLQAAVLLGATLQGADLQSANLFRARCPIYIVDDVSLDESVDRCLTADGATAADTAYSMQWPLVNTHEIMIDSGRVEIQVLRRNKPVPFGDADAFSAYMTGITRDLQLEETKATLRERLRPLSAAAPPDDKILVDQQRWKRERLRSLTLEARAQILEKLACADAGTPYVARALILYGRLQATGSNLLNIADRMRKGKSDLSACPGVKGFTDDDWAKLDELVKKAPPPEKGAEAPKQ